MHFPVCLVYLISCVVLLLVWYAFSTEARLPTRILLKRQLSSTPCKAKCMPILFVVSFLLSFFAPCIHTRTQFIITFTCLSCLLCLCVLLLVFLRDEDATRFPSSFLASSCSHILKKLEKLIFFAADGDDDMHVCMYAVFKIKFFPCSFTPTTTQSHV